MNRMNDAQTRPRREYTPKPKPIYDFGEDNQSNGGYSTSAAPPPSRNSGKKQPLCRALVRIHVSYFYRGPLSQIHLLVGIMKSSRDAVVSHKERKKLNSEARFCIQQRHSQRGSTRFVEKSSSSKEKKPIQLFYIYTHTEDVPSLSSMPALNTFLRSLTETKLEI